MTRQCINCRHLNLRESPKFANSGFGRCKFDPSGVFVGVTRERECDKFSAAPVETQLKRKTWNDQVVMLKGVINAR